MKKLRQFYSEHEGKVSDKWDLYLDEYDRIFQPYRDKPLRLLEIGVQNGGSLEIWGKFFPKAEVLVGCDINRGCENLTYESANTYVVIGDANTDESEQKVSQISEEYDIIIDDGSHTSEDIVRSFERYFKRLKYGGTYVAEDLHCSYWETFGGGLYNLSSSISFFKQLVDVLNYEHWGLSKNIDDVLALFKEKYGIALSAEILQEIHSVEFINSLCVIRKNEAACNNVGARNVAGRVEEVVQLGNGYRGMDIEVEPQKMDERATHPFYRICELDAKLRALREEAAELKLKYKQLENQSLTQEEERLALQGEVSKLQGDIYEIYQSTSWKYSRPLRIAGLLHRKVMRVASTLIGLIRRTGGLTPAIRKIRKITAAEGFGGLLRRYRAHHGISADASDYDKWIEAHGTLDDEVRLKIKEDIASLTSKPLVSVVMPTFNPDLRWLNEAIDSVSAQLYDNWELCIADDKSTEPGIHEFLRQRQQEDTRIKVIFREENGHIAAATNSAMSLATGEWIALMDQDDLLTEDALYENVKAIMSCADANLIYSDEDKVNEAGKRSLPLYKPDWSPHLALSQAFVGHLCLVRSSIAKAVGGFRSGFNGSQDHDLWLRVAAKSSPEQIVHVPKVLYHWRQHKNSTAMESESKPYAWDAGQLAVQDYFNNKYPNVNATVEKGKFPFTYKMNFNFVSEPKVSIIIPTRDGVELLKVCVDGILKRTDWSNLEILILDNGSIKPETFEYFEIIQADERVSVIREDIDFNWSLLNNIGASQASGEYLIFLNNDTDVTQSDWVSSLVGYASLPDVGVVGALLLFEDGTIQHSGVVVGMGGWADHVYRTCPPSHFLNVPFISPVVSRNVLAVTGACMAVNARKFEEMGGFDEAFTICGSDVELGIRAHKQGYFNVLCADVQLYHYESKTRSSYVPENDFVQSDLKYKPYRKEVVDPFYNKNLRLDLTKPRIKIG